MKRSMALVAALLAAFPGPAAQAQVKLEVKFPEGASWKTRSVLKSHQVLTLNGMDIETDSENATVIDQSVGKRAADGTLPVKETLDSVRVQLTIAGIEIVVDSSQPDAAVPIPQLNYLKDIVRALHGASYTVVLDKDNKVKAVEGTENVLNNLEGKDPMAIENIKGRWNAQMIKTEYAERLESYPDILVRKGEPWERTDTLPLESGQKMSFKKRYEYLGTVEKDGKTLDKIGVKVTDVTYSVDPDANGPVKSGKDFQVVSSDGTILFDRAAGRTVESQSKTRIKGEISLSVQGMDLDAKLDLTLDSNTKQDAPKDAK